MVATLMLMGGGARHGDSGACTHITCLVSRHRQLEANAHKGRAGDRYIMLISKVSMCTILTVVIARSLGVSLGDELSLVLQDVSLVVEFFVKNKSI